MRKYVKNCPTARPKARRFQVGDPVVFCEKYHVDYTGLHRKHLPVSDAVVVSHDCYYWEAILLPPDEFAGGATFVSRGTDSYYTVRFIETGEEKSWVRAGQLLPRKE